MKSPYVNELETSKVVTATLLVHAKEIRQKKSGEPYLSLQLGDRTGDIEAKMWDNVAEVMNTFERDDFIKVKGLVQVYNNRPQFTIHKMQRLQDCEVDPADFFPASLRDPNEMFAELRQIAAGMENPHLRALIGSFLDDEEIAARYRKAPAAKAIHHAFLGGLLEHVLSLCGLCRLLAAHYKTVDLDLLLTGAILHDIGKIYELSYDRGFSYSTEGQLLGHIAIALRLLERKLNLLPDFPPTLRALVEHMILSHHGQLEFGSPKVPLFPEALLLHYLDDLDAKMECMRAIVDQDRQVDGCWTGYSPPLERVVLKKVKYLAGEPPASAQPAAEGIGQLQPTHGREQEVSGEERPERAEESPAAAADRGPVPSPPAPAPRHSRPETPAPRPKEAQPAPRRDTRTPSLFGEKLGQALQIIREDE